MDAVLEACRENGSYFAGYGYFDFLRPEFEATSPLVHAHGLIQAGYVHERGFVRQFRAEPDLSFASVSPPAPFSGSATFTDGRLEGDLAVEFPGTRSFRLTPADATLTDDLSESCLWGWDGARAAGAGDSSPGLRAALEQLGRLARRG